MLKCCGRQLKPKRLTFVDNEGLKVLKTAYCTNSNCGILVIEIEKISVFGRTQGKQLLRGKRAVKYLEENQDRLQENRNYRQYKKNTAKGFHYCSATWDLKRNKISIETRELATDRLIKREYKDLNTKKVI